MSYHIIVVKSDLFFQLFWKNSRPDDLLSSFTDLSLLFLELTLDFINPNLLASQQLEGYRQK